MARSNFFAIRNAYEFLSRNLKGIEYLEDLGVDVKIISRYNLNTQNLTV